MNEINKQPEPVDRSGQAPFAGPSGSAVSFEQIEAILRGIDKDEMTADDGWWETSVGAGFGAQKLAEIKALFYPPNH